jgi:hypothetical protein
MSGTFVNIPAASAANYKAPVASVASLPASGNQTGDVRVTLDTASIYVWDGAAWVLSGGGGGGGITSLNGLTGATQTFATGTSGTDFSISSSGTTHTFNIPNASGTARGVVSTGTQTFAGNKTFTGDVTFNGDVIGISEYKVEKFTLDAGNISSKSVTLSETPTDLVLTRLVPIGGVEQDYGDDFTVTGTTLSWASLGLDGVLASGDEIIVAYN